VTDRSETPTKKIVMTHTHSTPIDAPFDDVGPGVTTALQDEGFGILSEIDVETTVKKKLDVDINQYQTLGACNPQLAHEGLVEEPELEALLPCNGIVYETEDGDVVASAVDPQQLLSVTDNPALDFVADDVFDQFERVISAVDEEFETVSEA
jgi:uncharacterized protein (DUF302 family)